MKSPPHIDRRTTIKWVLAASASLPLLRHRTFSNDAEGIAGAVTGYGTDPDLTKIYKPGDAWPLTFTEAQRRTAAVLCDLIIPQDVESPSASSVGVVDFLDEWISAPYPRQRQDRKTILAGLAWLDTEANRRFQRVFSQLTESQQTAICDDICYAPKARPQFAEAAGFFATYRDLTAGGFYTTPAGSKDIKYVGNVPIERFEGPPSEVLRRVGIDPASSSQ